MTYESQLAANTIAEKAPNFKPELGIILGSGLGHIADLIENAIRIPYAELAGFPICKVAGHGGVLHLGTLQGRNVACLQGRAHFYEGISMNTAKTLVRTLHRIGCHTMLGTNSAGSLRPDVLPGELVIVNDHINFQFCNPLVGDNEEDCGPRFVGMEEAYDPVLRKTLFDVAEKINLSLTEGVYIGVLGPSFETPAEIRAFRTWGADVVGMSTVGEVITARHCGLRVAVISVITNLAAGMSSEKLTHEGTLSGAKSATEKLTQLVLGFVQQFSAP